MPIKPDDYLSTLPIEQQERIKERAKEIVEEDERRKKKEYERKKKKKKRKERGY